MNGEEVKYIRRLIFTSALAIGGLIVVAIAFLADSSFWSVVYFLIGVVVASFVYAVDSDGYNRRLWSKLITWNNPPLQEQKRMVEEGEKA